MHDDRMRIALRATAVMNLGGALMFVFPASLGALVGLPESVPAVHRALLAFFVVLFGGAYAWLSRQPSIDRPLVAMTALGKAGAFAVVLGCWLTGAVHGRAVAAFSADLMFAALFAWWLIGSAPAARSAFR